MKVFYTDDYHMIKPSLLSVGDIVVQTSSHYPIKIKYRRLIQKTSNFYGYMWEELSELEIIVLTELKVLKSPDVWFLKDGFEFNS